jgi:hypothetical protein
MEIILEILMALLVAERDFSPHSSCMCTYLSFSLPRKKKTEIGFKVVVVVSEPGTMA